MTSADSACHINNSAGLPGPLPKIDGKQQDDQIHLSWKASTHDIITHYVIQVNPPPYAGNCASGECNTTDTNFTITEIQECENYVITVQAANCAGVGNTTSWNATHYGQFCEKVFNYRHACN